MNELTAALKEELNVDTAFTLPIFGGIDIPESIAVSWGIMAFLVIVSILLTRNLKVNHISKRQAIYYGKFGSFGRWHRSTDRHWRRHRHWHCNR